MKEEETGKVIKLHPKTTKNTSNFAELFFAELEKLTSEDFKFEELKASPTEVIETNSVFGKPNLQGFDSDGGIYEGADFSKSDLQEANFDGALLNGANLDETNLRGVIFCNAELHRVSLNKAKNIFRFNKQEGIECFAIVHDSCLMIHEGYFWGSLDEFEAKATAENAGYEAQIAYLRALEKMYCK
jgi:hypothetical protein